MRRNRSRQRGMSLIGLLVAMACVVVLFAILMNSMNQAVTGGGSTQQNTVRSISDEITLQTIYQTLYAYSSDTRGRYMTPSDVGNFNDPTLNTSENFWSAAIANLRIAPHQLISGNEFSANVWEDDDYDYTSYSPITRTFWDPNFVADLADESNVSFAHMPLYGDRQRNYWKNDFSRMPIFGNRGPKDGIENPNSLTYGRNQQWAGHIVFGDGSVRFVDEFVPSGLTYQGAGGSMPDNIFAMESGADGTDAILAFTQRMTDRGPVLQYD